MKKLTRRRKKKAAKSDSKKRANNRLINGLITVVIETPRHSIGKYIFDEKKQCFRLKKILPLGMAFPYDFGMIKKQG